MSIIDECKEIYKSAFDDNQDFINLLFDNCSEYIKFLKKAGSVAAMFFALPCEYENEKAIYIFAAATKKDEQGKGYMSELLNEYLKNETAICFLRPATDSLCDFYFKFGFIKLTASSDNEALKPLIPTDNFLRIAEKEKEPDFVLMANKEINEKIYFPYSMN